MQKNNLLDVLPFVRKYLENRPAFFVFIRPIEAALFVKARKYFKGKILDFGCGDGFFASLIFNQQEVDTALDLFNSRFDQAKDTGVYKKIVGFDGKKIPLKKNSYDVVVSNSVLEHIPLLEENLLEVNRILKPKGKFIVTLMTDQWEKNLLGGKILGQPYLKLMRKLQDHYNLLSVAQWEKTFKKAGFKVKEQVTYLPAKHIIEEEIWHYLSAPSWFSFILFKKWVLWPNWYKFIKLDKYFDRKLKNSLVAKDQAAAAFFVLEKTKKA